MGYNRGDMKIVCPECKRVFVWEWDRRWGLLFKLSGKGVIICCRCGKGHYERLKKLGLAG